MLPCQLTEIDQQVNAKLVNCANARLRDFTLTKGSAPIGELGTVTMCFWFVGLTLN